MIYWTKYFQYGVKGSPVDNWGCVISRICSCPDLLQETFEGK
ncbi:hypothetical protein SNOG_03899 [Parastagonospora nodorum SN15]|uniref:Uncharacterized protein n=1 Tax=Phaeosphaeria nodorum (strain SN15 / ATCC MYA-4574 / FGSC 10173) TaxID=321614 RepID=Q0UWG5_PHANO|nr:hypothetical protein SNOG_03899 [Parastagonospora nodorum SN15]EAT89104.1 hypothetical protein SNOG_03899 [Parastagonospora nodorum SN15]